MTEKSLHDPTCRFRVTDLGHAVRISGRDDGGNAFVLTLDVLWADQLAHEIGDWCGYEEHARVHALRQPSQHDQVRRGPRAYLRRLSEQLAR